MIYFMVAFFCANKKAESNAFRLVVSARIELASKV
jgi:hypothetical protein